VGIHAALAVHPASGHGAAARIADTVAERLRTAVDRLDVLVANSVEESRALMRNSHDAGLDVLIVLGGDGAAHQGVQFCANHGVALGLVPAGTGNDFARALGVPGEPLPAVDALVAALRSGARRRIDLGRVGDTWFATVLCAGFDASVNERANRMRWPSGPRRYDLAILAELAAFRSRPVVIDTGTERLELDATLVAIGNTRFYGGGVPICPTADPEDGVFDVTVIGHATRRGLIRMLPGLRTGNHVTHPAVRTFRAAAVTLTGNTWPAYADGEPQGTVPVTVSCVPGALTVLAAQ
jgi:diacylglycerol kinase (ATP)